LVRQSIYSRLAGYEDVNDAERLCLDPALRIVVGGRAKDQSAASTSEMARFETETLSTTENLKHLLDLSGKWIDQAHQHWKLKKLILDMDSRGQDFIRAGKLLPATLHDGTMSVRSRNRGPRGVYLGKIGLCNAKQWWPSWVSALWRA